jgi:hypothetical protein
MSKFSAVGSYPNPASGNASTEMRKTARAVRDAREAEANRRRYQDWLRYSQS